MTAPDEMPEGCDDPAREHLKRAEAKMEKALHHMEEAEEEVREANADMRKAEAEVEEEERCEIEVIVDDKPKHVRRGTYLVSVFKGLVGVAADRELDVVCDGVFKPLDDKREITPHECEVFVSHARTGGSS